MSKKTTIAWITENFVDVDLPVIYELQHHYDILWIISNHKSARFFSSEEYKKIQKSLSCRMIVFSTSRRNRNPLNISHYLKIIHTAKKFKADIYYMNILGFPFFHLLHPLFIKSRKKIYAVHDVIEHSGLKHRGPVTFYKKFIFNRFKYFHLFSKSQHKIFKQNHPNKHTFCSRLFLKDYGPPPTSYQKHTEELTHFLFFGKIRPDKGLNTLIEATNQLSGKHHGKFKVTIAGDCKDSEHYRTAIKNEQDFSLHFGFIENKRIPALFSQADYIVLPYTDMTQSGVLMVAYNYHVPAIASNLEEFRTDIHDSITGFLFETNNPHALAAIMEKTILNHTLHERIKNNLTKYIKNNFSITAISKHYSIFFDSITR